jgi:glycosyltransferase involved in cell wall biosynthesis
MKIYGNEQSVYQNNEEPYFSILMPVYNNQSTIVETLDSVINQTFQNFEIIIVNDGSIDDTKTVIKGFEDIRIRYFYQKNEDQLNALIKCISHSRGKVFFVLHGDDCLYNNTTLENAFNSFQEVNVDAIIGNIYLMDSHSRIYS